MGAGDVQLVGRPVPIEDTSLIGQPIPIDQSEPNPTQSGFSGWLNSAYNLGADALHQTGGYIADALGGARDTASVMGNAVLHPIRTVSGIGDYLGRLATSDDPQMAVDALKGIGRFSADALAGMRGGVPGAATADTAYQAIMQSLGYEPPTTADETMHGFARNLGAFAAPGVMAKVTKQVLKTIPQTANSFEAHGLGVRPTDQAWSSKEAPGYTTRPGFAGDMEKVTNLDQSIEANKADGLYDNGVAPVNILDTAGKKIAQYGNNLGKLLSNADKTALQLGYDFTPTAADFPNAADYVANLPEPLPPTAYKKFEEIVQGIQAKSDGTLRSLQDQKLAQSQGLDYANEVDPWAKGLRKAIRADLKTQIEKGYATVIKDPYSQQAVAVANQKLAPWLDTYDVYEKNFNNTKDANPFGDIVKFAKGEQAFPTAKVTGGRLLNAVPVPLAAGASRALNGIAPPPGSLGLMSMKPGAVLASGVPEQGTSQGPAALPPGDGGLSAYLSPGPAMAEERQTLGQGTAPLGPALEGQPPPNMPGMPQPVDRFANGLPRSTDQWDLMAVNRFAKFALNQPPEAATIAQGLLQKFQTAMHQEDKGTMQRLVSDMAKLFPLAFEPGLGVDNKLFHQDDQANYLDNLTSAMRKGVVTPSFLANQRDAFLNKNDSSILPVAPHVAQQLPPVGGNVPPQNGQPRKYTY